MEHVQPWNRVAVVEERIKDNVYESRGLLGLDVDGVVFVERGLVRLVCCLTIRLRDRDV